MTIGGKYRIEYLIITSFIAVDFVLHLISDFHSGFHCDELLHIDAGRHPDFGFMDFGPIISYLAFIQNLFQSDNIFINHLFVHIAAALIIFLCGLITIELGGKWEALLLTMSCILFSPGMAASHSLFLPVIFEQLAWIACIYFLIKYCNDGHDNYLIYTGILGAFGFLTKYSIVFLTGGLLFSILILKINILKKRAIWIGVLLFLILISPNVIWQFRNGLPVLHHFSRLYETQLDSISILHEFKSLLIYLNPLTSIIWITGLFLTPFILRFKKYRLVTFTLLFAFTMLFIAKGKAYYYFPIVLSVIPIGAIFLEQILKKRKLILIGYISLLSVSGLVLLPHGLPLIPLDRYISLYNFKTNGDKKIPLPFENYYSRAIWDQILKRVSNTYSSLPSSEQKSCLIWGRHYSQAGGINLLGKKYGLPPAFSFHSSCFNWVPEFSKDITVIAISDANLEKEYWQQYFNEVEEVGVIENPYAGDYKWYCQHIYLCRKLIYDSGGLKLLLKDKIF
jgi:hypothetical protein